MSVATLPFTKAIFPKKYNQVSSFEKCIISGISKFKQQIN